MELDIFAAEYKKRRPNASSREIDLAYQSAQPRMGLGESAFRGLAQGVFGLSAGVGNLGDMLGMPTKEFAEFAESEAGKYSLPTELQGRLWDDPSMLSDPRLWAHGLGQVIPSLSATLAGGIGGKALALGLGAGPKLAGAAQLMGGLAPGVAAEMGDFWQDSGDVSDTLLYGAGNAALNALPTERIFNMLGGKYAGNMLLETLASGGIEAVTEWAEEPLAALIKGESVTEAMKSGLNVMPGAFLGGLLPGGGRGLYDLAKGGKPPLDNQSLNDFLQQNYGMSEQDLPAMLRPQEDGMQVDVGMDTGIPAYLRPQAPEAPGEMLDSKYTEDLPAMLREQAGAPADMGMADRAPSVTDPQSGLADDFDTDNAVNTQMITGVREKMGKAIGDKTLNGLLDTGKVKIITRAEAKKITDATTIKPVISGGTPSGKATTPLSFFNPADGISYFIADNINKHASSEQLRGLALHEVGVHAATLGQSDKTFKTVLTQVDWMRRNGNKKMVEAYDRAVKAGTSEADLAHETLAYYVEANPNTSFAQKIFGWFKTLIRKIYPDLKYSESELVQMATSAMKSASKTPKQTRAGQPMYSRATTGDQAGVDANQPGATAQQTAPQSTAIPQQTEAQKVQQRVTDVGGKQTAFERKRGVMTNAESAKLAELTGIPEQILTQKLGDTYNVEELINAANDIRSTWNVGREQLAAIMAKHAKGQATQTDMIYAQDIVTRMAAMGAQFFGVRGEAGRALQIFKSSADATAKARVMLESVKGITSEQDLIDAITALTAVQEPGKAAEIAAKLYKATTADKLLEWYYMCLLSGIPTHVVNMVSTGMQGVVQEVDNLMAAGIGAITRSEDAITFAEIKARLGAIGKGTVLGLKEAARVFMQFEAKDFKEYGPNKLEGQGKRALPGVFGKAVRLPMRMLATEDAFWKAMLYNMGLAQEAARLSAKTGIDEATILANPNKEMQDNAWKQATQGTFTEQGGAITQSIQKFRKEHPAVALILPFVQTPGNIIKTAIRHSPAAPILLEVRADIKKGGRARDMVTARMAVGSSIMTVAYMLAMAGVITGQPPEDPNERRLWYMQGKQPYAVKMGDKWVSFSRLEPFGMLMGGAADFHDILNKVSTDEAETIWAALVSSIAKNLTSKTYLRGVSDFINMLTEPERYSESYFQRFVSTVMVPTGIAYTAKALDDRRREINSMGDAIKARLPGLRETLPAKLDVKGDPMMEVGSGLYRMVSPAYLSEVKNDRVASELALYDVSFPTASKKFRGIELSPDTHAELVKAMGKPTYLALERIVASKAYQAMPPESKKYVLQSAVNKLREGARKYWSLRHPEIMREAALLAREKKYGPQK